MKRAVLRSFIFDALFYLLVGLECVICLPFLLLPRRYFMGVVHGFVRTVYFLEKYILGLDYEVRGLENLPREGAFIVAAKHQSPYETMKLHILLKDPAVILKKELLSIPLWGLYLKKSDVIAIDRSTPDAAIKSIQDGARRMMAQGRPIVIFPQGTRVSVEQTPGDRPYKVGVARMQEATGLPIIPLALNTGLFWPRGSFLKSSGKVVFKFLEPIQPGKERKELLKELEEKIERETSNLMNEAQEKSLNRKGWSRLRVVGTIVLLAVFFGFYSAAWFAAADHVRAEYLKFLHNAVPEGEEIVPPIITGYPGKITFSIPFQRLEDGKKRIAVKDLQASGWPAPFLPVHIETGVVEVMNSEWKAPLKFDRLEARIVLWDEILTILNGTLTQGPFTAQINGALDLKQKPVPKPDLTVELNGHPVFLHSLEATGAVEPHISLLIGAALGALSDDEGKILVPITQRGNTLFAGSMPFMALPESAEEIAGKISNGTFRRDPVQDPGSGSLPAPVP